MQVIPDFATVNRCGGSCDLYSHRCVPVTTRTKRLEVMVVLSQFPRVQTETQCGYVEVCAPEVDNFFDPVVDAATDVFVLFC